MFASFLYDTLFFGKNQLSEIFFREHFIGVMAHYAEEQYIDTEKQSHGHGKSQGQKRKNGYFSK